MDNLIFCLNATVPIFAIIVLGRWLRSKNFFTKQTLTDIDRLSFKVLLPILLFRDIAQGRITEQFDPVFFFFCAGATTVYFFAVWIGASLFLKDKSMVGAFTQRFPRLAGDTGCGLCAESVRQCRSCAADDRGKRAAVQHLFGAGADCHRAGRTAGGPPRSGRQNAARHHHQPDHTGYFRGSAVLAPGNRLSADAGQGSVYAGQLRNAYGAAEHRRGLEGAKAIKKLGPTCAAVFIKLVLLSAIFLPMGVALGFREQTLVAIVILCGAPSTGLRLCYGEKYGRRSCFVIVDHCAQHGVECGYADIDAVYPAFDGAYLT